MHYEIIIVRPGYQQVLHKMDFENAHMHTQTENGFSFDFLEQYHKGGDEFLNHII
jgi:hypothetical protein